MADENGIATQGQGFQGTNFGDPTTIINLMKTPEGQARLNGASPEEQAAIGQALSSPEFATTYQQLSAPMGMGKAMGIGESPNPDALESVAKAIVPTAAETVKSITTPLGLGLGAGLGALGGPVAPATIPLGAAAGGTAATSLVNQYSPEINNWWRKNVINIFDEPMEPPTGPLTPGKMVGNAAETGLFALTGGAVRAGAAIGKRMEEAGVSRLASILRPYNKMESAVLSEIGGLSLSSDKAYRKLAEMGVFNTWGENKINTKLIGNDKQFIENVWGKIWGAKRLDAVGNIVETPGLATEYRDKVNGLIEKSGKFITPLDVIQSLENVKAKMLAKIASGKGAFGATAEDMVAAAKKGLVPIDDELRKLAVPSQDSAKLIANPLDYLQGLKHDLYEMSKMGIEEGTKGLSQKTTSVMQGASLLVKEEIEGIVNNVFKDSHLFHDIKAANSTWSDLITVGDMVKEAGATFLNVGQKQTGIGFMRSVAGSSSAGFVGAAPLMLAGQYGPAAGVQGAAVIGGGAIWAAAKFAGQAGNQTQISHLQRRSGKVLEWLGNVAKTDGVVNFYPRSIPELVAASSNIKRQLLLGGVDVAAVEAIDEVLRLADDTKIPAALSKTLNSFPGVSEFFNTLVYGNRNAPSSMYKVDGKNVIGDPVEVVDTSNRLRSSITPQNEVEVTRAMARLHDPYTFGEIDDKFLPPDKYSTKPAGVSIGDKTGSHVQLEPFADVSLVSQAAKRIKINDGLFADKKGY